MKIQSIIVYDNTIFEIERDKLVLLNHEIDYSVRGCYMLEHIEILNIICIRRNIIFNYEVFLQNYGSLSINSSRLGTSRYNP